MVERNRKIERVLQQASLQAALRDSFTLAEVVLLASKDNPDWEPTFTSSVVAGIQEMSIPVPAKDKGAAGRWQVRPSERRKIMNALSDEQLDAVRGGEIGTDIQRAIAGGLSFTPAELDAILADTAPDQTRLETALVAIERAGPLAPKAVRDRLDPLRGKLNVTRRDDQRRALVGSGFVGRQDYLEAIAAWVDQPQLKPPIRTLHLSGLPGVGKSFLLARALFETRSEDRPVLVELDFDRRVIDVLSPQSFFAEITTQIADELPFHAEQLRAQIETMIGVGLASETTKGSGSLIPYQLIDALGHALADAGRTCLFVLDTLEVLRSAGETHVEALFDLLDLLADRSGVRIAVISAGRGDALDPAPKRIERHISISGLADTESRELLSMQGVSDEDQAAVLDLADGNPLLLKLGARALQQGSDLSDVPTGAESEVLGGYLYRAILSRVEPNLAKIANEGLLLRFVDVDLLVNVVSPDLASPLSREEASALLEDLEKHHWLVETDSNGALRHRPDIRKQVLPLLYEEYADVAGRLNQRAAAWFAQRDPVEALYHALQHTRITRQMPDVPPDLASQFTPLMIEELPSAAADAVLQSAGQRSSLARSGTASFTAEANMVRAPFTSAESEFAAVLSAEADSGAGVDDRLVRELENMLASGDLREAAHIHAAWVKRDIDPNSRAGTASMCFLWRTGRWWRALQVFKGLDEETRARLIVEDSRLRGRVILEMEAEFRFDRLVDWLASDKNENDAMAAYHTGRSAGMERGALDLALVLAVSQKRQALPDALHPMASLVMQMLTLQGPTSDFDHSLAFAFADDTRRRFDIETRELAYEPVSTGPLAPPIHEKGQSALLPCNPYATPLSHLVSELANTPPPSDVLLDHPGWQYNGGRLLNDLGLGFFVGKGLVTGERRSQIVDHWNALGLTASWASGFAYFRRVRDLVVIARASERWERTILGRWSFGKAPENWHVNERLDEYARFLIRRFTEADDGAVAALRLMMAFAGDETKNSQSTKPRLRRARRLFETAQNSLEQSQGDPNLALCNLLDGRAPATVAAACTALATQTLHWSQIEAQARRSHLASDIALSPLGPDPNAVAVSIPDSDIAVDLDPNPVNSTDEDGGTS